MCESIKLFEICSRFYNKVVGNIRFGNWKKVLIFSALVGFGLILFHHAVAAKSLYQAGSTGVDVSWPPSNCSAKPPGYASFGIVGVTGGLNFVQNNCLYRQSHQFNQLSLYINTGYPGTAKAKKFTSVSKSCPYTNLPCLPYNYGYSAAEYALLYADSQNVTSNTWWLDVETMNSWSENVKDNQASIQGAIDAINKGNIFRPNIGIYSTPRQWKIITGGWKNKMPAWIGTGSSYRKDAKAACLDPPFTGGENVLSQYVLELDHDFSC